MYTDLGRPGDTFAVGGRATEQSSFNITCIPPPYECKCGVGGGGGGLPWFSCFHHVHIYFSLSRLLALLNSYVACRLILTRG